MLGSAGYLCSYLVCLHGIHGGWGSRHSEACPHTGNTNLYATMNMVVDTRCSVLTPRAALDNDFLTATQSSWEHHSRGTAEIILAKVHCNWSRTLAMLSYLNIPQSMFGIEVSPGSSVNRDQIQQKSTEQLEQL